MLNDAAKEQLRAIYNGGATVAEIARLLAVHPTTVSRWLKLSGVRLRRRGPRIGVARRVDSLRTLATRIAVARAADLIDGGMSVARAARVVGLSRQTLYKRGLLTKLKKQQAI